MTANSAKRNRYLVSFYQDGVLKHQFRSLGVDHRDAVEVTKKFLLEKDTLVWSEFDVVSEPRPLSIRLDEGGIEVHLVDIKEQSV